jgi:hypothetical protein
VVAMMQNLTQSWKEKMNDSRIEVGTDDLSGEERQKYNF